MSIEIELKNVGRNKVCKLIKTNLSDLTLAEHRALEEALKCLASRDVWIQQKGERFSPDEYTVYAGGRNVGEISIRLQSSVLN